MNKFTLILSMVFLFSFKISSAEVINFGHPFAQVYRGGWLFDEELSYTELKDKGVTTILNLHTTADDKELCRQYGIKCIHHPIVILPFFDIFQSDKTFQKAFWKAKEAINQNETLYIHCRHGSDRTGLVIAALRLEELLCQGSKKEVSIEDQSRILQELHNHNYHSRTFPGILKKLSKWIEKKPEWLCQKPEFVKEKKPLVKRRYGICDPGFLCGVQRLRGESIKPRSNP